MATTITDVLNIWNDIGVFSYVIPFLLIFAVVFAILKKTKILSGQDENNGILAIISVAVGLLALQFDFVSEFFAVIFPRFGVGLSVFLVLIIFLGFFYQPDDKGKWSGAMTWIGWVVGIGAVIWAFDSWGEWMNFGFGGWIGDNFWAIVILGAIVGTIIGVTKSKSSGKKPGEQ